MSGYHEGYQGEQENQEGGQHQIQAFYEDDEDYNSRSQTRRPKRSRFEQDFGGYAHEGQYDYSDGHQDYLWNQFYSAWGSYGYSDGTYYSQGDNDAQYHYERPWDEDPYAYSENTYTQRNHYNARASYERPQPRDFPAAEVPPRSPSPSYLATSLDPSEQTDPAPRKLLILDLNGTLLVRSKPPPLPQGRGPIQPLKRTVTPRPYFTSFREYLLHPATRKWLDVMVWSSAQPHSVRSMLQHCFPATEGAESSSNDDRFIAVWARDTLGLSSVDYSRKAQTVKDLRKPWRQLAPSDDAGTKHSANTTLLLDDSPRKAYLQPWNHVCVPEYDAAALAADTRALAHQSSAQPSGSSPRSTTPPTSLDHTLLAIIGILEKLRLESNVAGWVRAGGLCPKRHVDDDALADDDGNMAIGAGKELAADAVVQDPAFPDARLLRKRARDADGDDFESTSAKRARNTSPPEPPADASSSSAIPAATSPPPSSAAQPSSPSARSPKDVPDTPSHHPVAAPDAEPRSSAQAQSTPSAASPQRAAVTPSKPPAASLDAEPSPTAPLWFDDAPTLTHWIDQGRAALRACGIAEVAGEVS